MKIYITSIFVDDQDKALAFYTEKLGFVKQDDVPLGEYRWLTVVEPERKDGMKILLEPNAHKAVPPFKDALKQDGIPFTSFEVDDITQEFDRLKMLNVEFTQEPTSAEEMITAVFDDTCGNLIQIIQHVSADK